MRRFSSVTFWATYVAFLLSVTVIKAHAAATADGVDSFAVFFWSRIDWASFGTAAFIALVAGAIRTGSTLLNKQPTFRVLLEGVVDALTSLAVGALAFLLLMIWQSARGPVNNWVMFGFIFGAGLMRGGFITFAEEFVKKILAAITDGVVGWVASKAASIAANQTTPPKDTP